MLRAKPFVGVRLIHGVLSVYRDKGAKTDFSALKNPKSLADMEFIVKLNFQECTKRTQDLEFAEQNGFSLDMKVCTRYIPDVSSKYKIAIGNSLFSVRYFDKTNNEIYWYLSKERDLDVA